MDFENSVISLEKSILELIFAHFQKYGITVDLSKMPAPFDLNQIALDLHIHAADYFPNGAGMH